MRAPGQRVGGIGGHAGGESTGSDQGGAIVEGNTPRRRARKARDRGSEGYSSPNDCRVRRGAEHGRG